MKQIKTIFFLLMMAVVTSCSEKDTPLSGTNELLEFNILKKHNPELEESIEGFIEGNTIKLTLHDAIDAGKLIVSFAHNGMAVYVDNVQQTSGSTPNDFTQELQYVVVAEDGSKNAYNIEAYIISSKKELISFSIDQENNPELEETIVGEIEGNTIKLTMNESKANRNLIATFEHNGVNILLDGEEQESGITVNNFMEDITYVVVAEDNSEMHYVVKIDWIRMEKRNLPHVYVDIENGEPMETVDKSRELNAVVRIDGKMKYEDYEGKTIIRGRGNSTWGMPKKPYRLKLDKAASLMGLPAHKNWVLLNEYLDGSMLENALPYKAGHLLEMPYTNTIIPVELTINGEYRGVYAFTEHKEVAEGRIDIGDDGLLLEMDVYYDEDWKFYSNNYRLPVMIQFPKSKNMNQEKLDEIRNDFNQVEQLVFDSSFPNNNYLDYWDDLSFVNYMIVYELIRNAEINHPKSTYLNKLAGGKYRMGIIWDFDWGYGYSGSGNHYVISRSSNPLFSTGSNAGTRFFSRIMSDPHIKSLFKERWEWFKANKMDELEAYVKDYADIIADGLADDHARWGKRNGTSDPDANLNRLLEWLNARTAYIDNMVADW